MRILHLINDLRIGGAETLLCNLAPRLKQSGIQIEVAALRENPTFLRDTLQTAAIPYRDNGSRSFYSPQHLPFLTNTLRGFDLVHVHLYPAQLWARLAVALLPKRHRPLLVTTEHSTHNRRREKPLLRPLDAFTYHGYTRIVAISQPVADSLITWLPATRSRLCILENGIDTARFAHTPPADKTALLNLPPETPLAVCVGRLEAIKNQTVLLMALRHLPEWHVALIGEGSQREALEQRAQTLGIGNRVHFLGKQPETASLMKMATAYVQPSRHEGFGLAVVEAMAAGVPCVVSDVPGIREVVGDAALRFPSDIDGELADRLKTLHNNPQLAQTLTDAGRRRAARYDLRHCIDSHIALYNELLTPPSSAT